MPIYQTAHYRVNAGAVDRVLAAIEEFVGYVAAHEPDTWLYTAWQQKDDPTRFVHLFTFADEAAHRAHGESEAVRRFQAVYTPELSEGPVVFTDYRLVATNAGRRPPAP
ncbi:antibiotic biosynthesis monooxygenase family protein [Kitasatospora sp. NPDC093558]|uniref:putative quinol monooxygenase n=1 Tax=Kitasatospora sp. NPDC093558 TaxID=3155201 RepID=UPI003441BBF9